jgi:hypothetical protein
MPLHLVVQDSRGHRVGDGPLSDIPRGESFSLRPGVYRVVIVDGCFRRINLRSRAHAWLSVVLLGSGCQIYPRAAPYAGLARAEALAWSGRMVIRVNYRGDVALFNRNLSDVQTRRTRDAEGRRAWLVKFYDGQALRSSCAYARRGQVPWAHVHLVPCAKTVIGAGKPK